MTTPDNRIADAFDAELAAIRALLGDAIFPDSKWRPVSDRAAVQAQLAEGRLRIEALGRLCKSVAHALVDLERQEFSYRARL